MFHYDTIRITLSTAEDGRTVEVRGQWETEAVYMATADLFDPGGIVNECTQAYARCVQAMIRDTIRRVSKLADELAAEADNADADAGVEADDTDGEAAHA